TPKKKSKRRNSSISRSLSIRYSGEFKASPITLGRKVSRVFHKSSASDCSEHTIVAIE
ncbi:hypothetical protein HDV04_004966, partial [Boothiomyces sp. JEL0838]